MKADFAYIGFMSGQRKVSVFETLIFTGDGRIMLDYVAPAPIGLIGFLWGRLFFITCRLAAKQRLLADPAFACLARVIRERRIRQRFLLTALVFLAFPSPATGTPSSVRPFLSQFQP